MWSQSLFFAALSGLYASLASVCGKLALSSHVAEHWLKLLPDSLRIPIVSLELLSLGVLLEVSCVFLIEWSLRIAGLLGLIYFNASMLSTFAKALATSDSTVTATGTNFAFNFFFSGISGLVVFNEPVVNRWWLGASLMLLGVLLINRDASKRQDEQQHLD